MATRMVASRGGLYETSRARRGQDLSEEIGRSGAGWATRSTGVKRGVQEVTVVERLVGESGRENLEPVV